ncbi:MAG TPA: helix-turn-helix transcriptional regulator [Thermoanaerobaculia bacterium]|nr:helix-turn-helix transcriptional regulator [Thermoanaerobaculia bacterium]
MGAFDNLGQALRWLRNRQQRKQYEIAEAAGITKAMLSAYETGKQNPSVETLDKLLSALGSDLSDLHDALVLNQGGRPPAGLAAASSISAVAERPGQGAELPEEWERPLSQLLEGFQTLVRQVHRELGRASRAVPPGSATGPEPGSGPASGPRRIGSPPPLRSDEEE